MTTRPKKRPGRAAGPDERGVMVALGYESPARIAKAFGVALQTVYSWASERESTDPTKPPIRGALVGKLVKGKNAVVKTARGVWILKAAAAEMRPTAKSLARATIA